MMLIFSEILFMMLIFKISPQFVPLHSLACDKLECNPKWKHYVWFSYGTPRLSSPNVCAVEEVMGSRKRYYSECMTYMPRKICLKPTFIRYHCCTGFEKIDPDSKGCQGVVPIQNLMDTAKHLYLKEYRKVIKSSKLDNKFRQEGTFTLFAPENKAFRDLTPQRRRRMRSRAESKQTILYHATQDRYYLKDLVNGMHIQSLAENNPDIKINRYSNGIVTVNCARIILPNQIATNGILHTIEKVIEPIQEKGNIMEILIRDDRFGEFVTALVVTQLVSILRDENRQFTLFVPTDEAFTGAPPDVVDRILNDKETLEKLLKYHMLEENICSAAILGKSIHRTLEGQKVNLTCDINDNLRVNDIPVKFADIVGTNGIIHVIDKILIPDAAKSLKEVMGELELYEFMEYAQQAGASDIISGKAEGNYTIFVPSQKAFRQLTRRQRYLLQTQPAAVKKVFQYHIIPGRVTTKNVVGSHSVLTNSGKGSRLQLTLQQNGFTVNGAQILSGDHEAGNGVVHIIDRILMPPEGTVIDKIKEESRLSTFLASLQTSNNDGLLLEPEGNFTVFAPTNDAFESLENSYLERLMLDTEQLSKFLKYHIVTQPVYVSTMKPKLQYRYESLTNDWVRIKRSEEKNEEDETINYVNDQAEILGDMLESSNGVVYVIDEVLRCPCLEGSPNEI